MTPSSASCSIPSSGRRSRRKGSAWRSLLTELVSNVKEHVAEGEGQIFPKLRTVTTESELVELGEKLEDAKKGAPTHPHPHSHSHAPRSGTGAKVAGMAAGVVDRVRDAS